MFVFNKDFWLSLCLMFSSSIIIAEPYKTDEKKMKVETTSGKVEGILQEGVYQFLGIPYAEPPVGDLRWALTKPAKNWKGIRSAETNSKICFQPKQIADFYDRVPDWNNMSEDCLTLNVWTRAKDTNEKLPVMVWFHGGALVWGSGSEYPGLSLIHI